MINKNIVFASFEGKEALPPGYKVINITHSGKDIFKSLSPVHPGKIYCYGGFTANSLHNAWQFSRVLKEYDNGGVPSAEWYKWRDRGFRAEKTFVPAKKPVKHLYYWWNDARYGEPEFRKRVMFPLYRDNVSHLPSFKLLEKMFISGEKLCFRTSFAVNDDRHIDEIIADTKIRFEYPYLLYKVLTGE